MEEEEEEEEEEEVLPRLFEENQEYLTGIS